MKKSSFWVAAGIVALALGIRLIGIDWGLPQVYEEAYPFKRSWPMWGWGPDAAFDLNPHFFNYPTLYFYVQFLGQGLLYLLLRLGGVVSSVIDYRMLYELDKTPFYIMGRTLTVLFAGGSVLVTYVLGRRVHSVAAGAVAAFLVAINAFHISKSQVIEVDVPLTLFVLLTLWMSLRILEDPKSRHYVLAGLFAGMATSTKYSGLFLLLPIACAHFLAMRRLEKARQASRDDRQARPQGRRRVGRPEKQRPLGWGLLLGGPLRALAVFALALLATSPFILLDFDNFWIGFNYERLHMQLGHFGLDQTPAFFFYVRELTRNLLGWPLALTSVVALFYWIVRRRAGWALVLAAFPLVYVAVISSFSMKADRYVLPLVPVACILAAAFAMEWLRHQRWAVAGAVGTAVLLGAPSLWSDLHDRSRLRDDTRTLARQWIEKNVPAGSYIVTEAYGPEPLSAIDLANLDTDLAERIVARLGDTKVYAMYPIPMLQVRPELSAPFYSLSQYADLADYIVTSSSVSSRYRKDPELFAPMVAFYDSLEARFALAREFGPEDGVGPRLRLYKNPNVNVPFSQRGTVAMPSSRPLLQELVPGVVGPCYQRMAVNFETFGYDLQAADAYLIAVRYAENRPGFQRSVLVGAVRCYLRAGRPDLANSVIDRAERAAPNAEEARYWQDLRRQLTPNS